MITNVKLNYQQKIDIAKKMERYKNFKFLNEGNKFNEYFADKEFDIVQIHSTESFIPNNSDDVNFVGFCGKFSWKNNKLESLDGDTYNESVEVIGYKEFETNDYKKYIDILVGVDW